MFVFFKCLNRLSYAVWLLQELVQRNPTSVHMNMMYDIACILVQHLRASEDGDYLLDRIKFALPSFHAYGHNAACQVSIAMYWNTSEKFILPQMSKFVMCVHIMCVCVISILGLSSIV